MIPEVPPTIVILRLSEILFFFAYTTAAPRSVPIKGISIPKIVSLSDKACDLSRCVIRERSPIKIRIVPPMISEPDLYRIPNICPIFTPIMDIMHVITPIIITAITTFIIPAVSNTFTGTATNVIPTASASILVATAIINIVLTSNSGFTSSGGAKASLIMLPPISESSINATQGATTLISFSNREPTR